MVKFNAKYFAATVLIFLMELFIAFFVHDQFVRPYLGDLLVVILIYCFIKSFLDLPVLKVAAFVLIFSFGVEILQYFNLIERLGWKDSKIAKLILGNTFSWHDLFMYSAGIICVILVENFMKKGKIAK
jgi:hypothetical protein